MCVAVFLTTGNAQQLCIIAGLTHLLLFVAEHTHISRDCPQLSWSLRLAEDSNLLSAGRLWWLQMVCSAAATISFYLLHKGQLRWQELVLETAKEVPLY